MKKVILILIAIMSFSAFAAKPSDKLVNALIKVESKGNNTAVGDNGNAVGCLQLWTTYVKDASSKKQKFTPADRTSRAKSIAIFKAYMDKYATDTRLAAIRNELCSLEGRPANAITDDEIICRMHNGGMGFCYRTKKEIEKKDFSGRNRRVANTAYYWTKIQASM
jgi:hypothetical protein